MITKRLIQVLITLVIMTALCVIGLTLFVDPNRYKDLIATKIEEKIHHPVTINGEIDWSFWPGLGLSIENVHISEPNSTATLADIEKIKLSARLIPLLSKQIEINNLAVENTKVYLPKKINLNIISLDTELYIDMPIKSYEAQDGSVVMTVAGLDGFSQEQPIEFTFNKLSADLNTDNLTIDNLKADIFDGKLLVNAAAKNFSKKPTLEGNITAENLNPRQIAQAFGHTINPSDDTTFKKLDLNATFKNADSGFIIQPFTAQLDHSKITGNLNVNSTHPFKAKGDVAIDTLTVSGMTFTQTQIHIDANNNIIRFAPLKTQLPSGSLQSTTILNIQQSTPRWDIDATLNNMLFNSAKFTGSVNGHAKISANGFDSQTFLKTLNGTANVNIADGTLNNIDLAYWLSVGESMLLSAKNITTLAIDTAQAAVGKNNTHHTTFKEMSGSFNIKQGVAHNNDLKVSNDTIFANGKGIIDLPKQQINYSVNVGRQGSQTQIPLKISGDLKSPNVGIDPSGIKKLLFQGVKNGLADTMTGGVVPAIGAGEAIINSDTIKGLFGR
jgi:AsmA protein